MAPVLSVNDATHRSLVNTKPPSENADACPRTVQTADVKDLILGQFRFRMTRAAIAWTSFFCPRLTMAPLRDHIPIVVSLSPFKNVRRIATRSVIAAVQPAWIGVSTIGQEKGSPVRGNPLAPDANLSVTSSPSAPSPRPTRIRTTGAINIGPKAFGNRHPANALANASALRAAKPRISAQDDAAVGHERRSAEFADSRDACGGSIIGAHLQVLSGGAVPGAFAAPPGIFVPNFTTYRSPVHARGGAR